MLYILQKGALMAQSDIVRLYIEMEEASLEEFPNPPKRPGTRRLREARMACAQSGEPLPLDTRQKSLGHSSFCTTPNDLCIFYARGCYISYPQDEPLQLFLKIPITPPHFPHYLNELR